MTTSLASPAAPSPNAAEAAAELLRRRRARGGLLGFAEYTYPQYAPSWHHALLCDYLDRFVAGEIKRLLVCMPPQHGKSELISRRLPAFLLGRNPDCRIMACSHTADLASAMNRDVQRIMSDDPYRRLFPASQLGAKNVRAIAGPQPLRNSEIFEIAGRKGYYKCAGVGAAIVGRGFDVGLIDDPLRGREAADSPAQREAAWKWYTGDFLTRRGGENSQILMVATRWNPEDPPGKLLKLAEEDPKADQWVSLVLPAVREAVACDGDPRAEGEALWPARYPLSELEKTRAANPYDWWSQYQQRPRAQGSTEWPDEYFGGPGFWFDEWPDRRKLEVVTMALDPSKGSDAKAGDYQALVQFGIDLYGNEYVEADLAKRPMTAAQAEDGTALTEGMVEFACERYAQFRPEGLALEVNGFQLLLAVPFRALAKKLRLDLRIYPVDNRVNKNVRIRRLGDSLARRKVRFRRNQGTRLLVEQLKQFPVGDHDDGPDAFEMARRLAIELWNGKNSKRR